MDIHSPALPPHPGSFKEADEAWKRHDYQRTIEILAAACGQQPANAKLLLNLGEAYGLRYEYQRAEQCFDQAVKVASNPSETLADAGRRCKRFKQPTMANCYFRRAAEHRGVTAAVLVALAEFEQGHSRIEEALAYLQRALAVQPDDPGALLARARLHRVFDELETGEQVLRSLLAKPVSELTASVWYELGTNLDRQGSYAEAMKAFLSAKALIRPAVRDYSRELNKTYAEFRAFEALVSASTLKSWIAMGTELRPARRFAFLCGHPRSGTTLLEHVLDAHRGIVATDETSILFEEAYGPLSRRFPAGTPMVEVLQAASVSDLQEARSQYFRLAEAFVRQTIGDRLLLDKNPAMDVRIPIVARIFPESAFLIALRDPRDVVLSCFMLPLTTGEMGALYLSLEETAAHYAAVMGFSKAIRSKLPNPQLEVRYENLVRDLAGACRDVLTFLGLQWDAEVLRFNNNARSRPLRCAVDDAVAKPIFSSSVGRWRHYQKYLEPSLQTLAPFIRAFGYA